MSYYGRSRLITIRDEIGKNFWKFSEIEMKIISFIRLIFSPQSQFVTLATFFNALSLLISDTFMIIFHK